MKLGDKIRYLAEELGSQRSINGARFDGPKIRAGQLGEYLTDTQAAMKEAGHPKADDMAGWHMTVTKDEVDGATLFVPVHDDMFEAVES